MIAPLIALGAASLLKGVASKQNEKKMQDAEEASQEYQDLLAQQNQIQASGQTTGGTIVPTIQRTPLPIVTTPQTQAVPMPAQTMGQPSQIQAPGLYQPQTSDKRAKRSISPAGSQMDAYLAALSQRSR